MAIGDLEGTEIIGVLDVDVAIDDRRLDCSGRLPKREITSEIYVPWDNLLVGVEAAFRITELRVDTIPEALVMSGFGVLLYVGFINVANGLAWAAAEYADALLGGGSIRDISVEVVS